MTLDLEDALQQIRQLSASLRRFADKDEEQEVLGMAIPVVDAVLSEARGLLPDQDPLLTSVRVQPRTL